MIYAVVRAAAEGATPVNCKECKATLVGVQYRGTPEDYDGVSEWQCPACGARYGRWTGARLKDGELEGRYGHAPRTSS